MSAPKPRPASPLELLLPSSDSDPRRRALAAAFDFLLGLAKDGEPDTSPPTQPPRRPSRAERGRSGSTFSDRAREWLLRRRSRPFR